MKALVIQKGWTSFTITDSGHAYFKKIDYELNETHPKKNNGIKSIWIYNARGHKTNQQSQANQKKIPDQVQPGWAKVSGKDLPGEGDVHSIANWPSKHTFDEILQMVKDKTWSGVTFGKEGTTAQNRCYFKKVSYGLTPTMTQPNPLADSIWINLEISRAAPQLTCKFTWHP